MDYVKRKLSFFSRDLDDPGEAAKPPLASARQNKRPRIERSLPPSPTPEAATPIIAVSNQSIQSSIRQFRSDANDCSTNQDSTMVGESEDSFTPRGSQVLTPIPSSSDRPVEYNRKRPGSDIIDQLDRENTIAVLGSDSEKQDTVLSVLRSVTARNQRACTLLIVSSVTLLTRAVDLQRILQRDSQLSVGTCFGSNNEASTEFWELMTAKNVVVSSAQSFDQALYEQHVALNKFSLLIIDDENGPSDALESVMCHYSVMKGDEPRILGLVVPPAGVTFEFDENAVLLERLLISKFHGVSPETRAQLKAKLNTPEELVVFYDALLTMQQTNLYKILHSFDSEELVFGNQFKNARHALRDVGTCASDLVWRRTIRNLENTVRPVFEEYDDSMDEETRRRKVIYDVYSRLKDWSYTMPNFDPGSKGFNVVPKFAKLVEILKACESYGEAFRCIVYVHRRSIAFVLHELIRMLSDSLPFIRAHAIPGHSSFADAETQRSVLQRFRNGTYNLLIATKFAEDLEMPRATCVVRYDLFESSISYAQTRACLQGAESHLILMAERGSDKDRRILSHIAKLDTSMWQWVTMVSTPESAIPPPTLHETVDPYRSDSDDEDEDDRIFIKDATTNGRIYVQDATTVIYRYAASVKAHRNARYIIQHLFIFEESIEKDGYKAFTCMVQLPSDSPISTVVGPKCPTRSDSRRLACYQACVELHRAGLLDYRLFPQPPVAGRRLRPRYLGLTAEELSDDEDSRRRGPQPKSGSGSKQYRRKTTDFWNNVIAYPRTNIFFPTVLSPKISADGIYKPMLIITKLPIPDIDPFNMYMHGSQGLMSLVRGAPLTLNHQEEGHLLNYTLRVCRAITGKNVTCHQSAIPFLLAPLDDVWSESRHRTPDQVSSLPPDISGMVAWNAVMRAADAAYEILPHGDPMRMEAMIADAIILDRHSEFGRRLQAVRLRYDLNPLSKPGEEDREKEFPSFLDYVAFNRRDFQGITNMRQPLIEVTRPSPLLNLLNPSAKENLSQNKPIAKYLIPEICSVLTLPASIFRTATLLPSVLRRIEDLLSIKETNARLFNHAISEVDLLSAVTSKSARMDHDYERLELLGDAYLKYLATIYLYVTKPAQKEGAMHYSRQRIISNKALLKNADRTGIPPMINIKQFQPKSWLPPVFECSANQIVEDDEMETGLANGDKQASLNEDTGGTRKTRKQRDDPNVHTLGEKIIADVAEAIIGAAYLSGGRECALSATKALNIPVPHVDRWSDFKHLAMAPPPEVTPQLRTGTTEAVESIVGHEFVRPHLLAQALTHHVSSNRGYEMTHYERLEFIGDAILDFLVIGFIYERDGKLSPGSLTTLKAAMVSNNALAALCVHTGLHKHLHHNNKLTSTIDEYVSELDRARDAEYSQAQKENRSPGQYWVDVQEPKPLSDVIESILGALFVSDNFSSVGADIFFEGVIKPFFARHVTFSTLWVHPTQVLQELLQKEGCQDFEVGGKDASSNGESTIADVIVHDIVLARGIDHSAERAARFASYMALDALGGDPDFLKRNCNCRELAEQRRQAKIAARVVTQQDAREEMDIEEQL